MVRERDIMRMATLSASMKSWVSSEWRVAREEEIVD